MPRKRPKSAPAARGGGGKKAKSRSAGVPAAKGQVQGRSGGKFRAKVSSGTLGKRSRAEAAPEVVAEAPEATAKKRRKSRASACLQPARSSVDVLAWRHFDFEEAWGGALVGRYLTVYWDGEDDWFEARVLNFHPETRQHYLHYPADGQSEWLDLREQPCLVQTSSCWARVQGHGWWPARAVEGSPGLEAFLAKAESPEALKPGFGLAESFVQRCSKSFFVVFYVTEDRSWLPKSQSSKSRSENVLLSADPPLGAQRALTGNTTKGLRLQQAREAQLEDLATEAQIVQDVRALFVEEAKLRCGTCEGCGIEDKVFKTEVIVTGNKPHVVVACETCRPRYEAKEYCSVCVRLWKSHLEYKKEIVLSRPVEVETAVPEGATALAGALSDALLNGGGMGGVKGEPGTGGLGGASPASDFCGNNGVTTPGLRNGHAADPTLPPASTPARTAPGCATTPSAPISAFSISPTPDLSARVKDILQSQEKDAKMFGCDVCGMWVHNVCDGIDDMEYARACTSESRHYSSDYFCPICRHVYILGAIDAFAELDVDALFQEPVTEDIAPGYFKVISHPMDLRTMRAKATRGVYRSSRMLKTDFELMVFNAVHYNPVGGVIGKAVMSYYDRVNRLVAAESRRALDGSQPGINLGLVGLAKVGPTEHAVAINALVENSKKQKLMSRRLKTLAKGTGQVKAPPLVPDPHPKPRLRPRLMTLGPAEATPLACLDLCSLCGSGFGAATNFFPSPVELDQQLDMLVAPNLDAIFCVACGEAYHAFCMEEAGYTRPRAGSSKAVGWMCPNCTPLDMAYHTYRHRPPPAPVPQAPVTPPLPVVLAEPDNFCPICATPWEDDDSWMVQCDDCGCWVHAGCDEEALRISMLGTPARKAAHFGGPRSRGEYSCSICKYEDTPESHLGVTPGAARLLLKVAALQAKRLQRIKRRRLPLAVPGVELPRSIWEDYQRVIKMARAALDLNQSRTLSKQEIKDLRRRVSTRYDLIPNWMVTRAARFLRRQCLRELRGLAPPPFPPMGEPFEGTEEPRILLTVRDVAKMKREAMGAAAFLALLWFEEGVKVGVGKTPSGRLGIQWPGGLCRELLLPPFDGGNVDFFENAGRISAEMRSAAGGRRPCLGLGIEREKGQRWLLQDTAVYRGWSRGVERVLGAWEDPRFCCFCGLAEGANPLARSTVGQKTETSAGNAGVAEGTATTITEGLPKDGPHGLGRLLPLGDGAFGHANCAVWSSEAYEKPLPRDKLGWGTAPGWDLDVSAFAEPTRSSENPRRGDSVKAEGFEGDGPSPMDIAAARGSGPKVQRGVPRGDGSIMKQVDAARKRARILRCSRCQCIGATLGCCSPGCSVNYHLSCAIAEGAKLTTMKQVFCKAHAPPDGDDMRALPSAYFREPLRCLMVGVDDVHGSRQPGPLLRPNLREPPYRIGSLTVLAHGEVTDLPRFHDRTTLYPRGYKAVRIHWSSQAPVQRCAYVCEVLAADAAPTTGVRRGPRAKGSLSQKPVFKVTALEPESLASSASSGQTRLRTWTGDGLASVVAQVLRDIRRVQPAQWDGLRHEAYLTSGPGFFGLGLAPVRAALEFVGGTGVVQAALPHPTLAPPMPGPLGSKAVKSETPGVVSIVPYGCSFRTIRQDEAEEAEQKSLAALDTEVNPYGCARANPNPNLKLRVQASQKARNASARENGTMGGGRKTPDPRTSTSTSTSSVTQAYRLMKAVPFHERLEAKRSRIHGWGLFTRFPIPRDGMIVEYVGQLIGNTVGDVMETFYETVGIGSCYMFRLNKTSIVDATRWGNLARFMNHCCQPNAYAKVIQVNTTSADEGLPGERIVICAKREIQADEEVTYDYKFASEDGKLSCMCGAPNCRGAMN